MSTFIEQAKEVLSSEKVTRLELLARKSADFETSVDEDNELFELKKEVKQLIATRDRQKNLEFLKVGAYEIKDILEVMGTTHADVVKNSGLSLADIFKALNVNKKQVTQASNEFFKGVVSTDGDGKPKFYDGVFATYGAEDINLNARIGKELGKLIAQGGEKTFVANLTDSGKEWIVKSYLSEKGPYKGQQIFKNLNDMAQKFKFNKETLKKELGLIKVEEKVPAPTKKQEKKVA